MISIFKTVQSFVQFLWNWKIGGGNLLDQNTANIRASICVGCHNNLPSGEVRKGCCGGGAIANAAVNVARKSILGFKSTPSDKKLLTCKLCGCDNRITVWIPNAALLKPEEANAYPSFCFKKAVLQGKDL